MDAADVAGLQTWRYLVGPHDPTTDEPKLRPFSSPWCVLALSLAAQAQDQTIPADGPTVITTASGLSYSVLKSVEGDVHPEPGDLVSFHYSCWLEGGRLIDTSRGSGLPLEMILGVGMIKAWIEGLGLMTPGTQLKMHAPSALAFGSAGAAVMDIPPQTRLIYEIELFSVSEGIELPVFSLPDRSAQKTTSSGLKYEVLREGQGRLPQTGEGYEVAYTVFNQRGELIDTSRLLWKQTITGRLGQGTDGSRFVEEAVSMLPRGGVLRLEVPAELGNSKTSIHVLAPPSTTTYWVIELVGTRPAPTPREVPEFAILDHIKARRTESGLRFEIVEAGSGNPPGPEDTVIVHYAGWLTTGKPFDDTMTEGLPRKIPLGHAIPGWREVLQLMPPGAVYRFTVPARLGYGLRGNQELGIGPNRELYYYVELIEVERDRR